MAPFTLSDETAQKVLRRARKAWTNRSSQPISQRSSYVEKRRQVGHLESDTIVGANYKQAIMSQVERKTGYAFLAKVSQKTSALVCSSIIRRLKGVAPLVN